MALGEVLAGHPSEVAAGTFEVVACLALFCLSTAVAFGYGTGTLRCGGRVFIAASDI